MAEFTLGDQMPNFQLNATDGTTFDFHQFQQTHPNQWYFVINFRGSWCPVCMEELDSLIKNVGYFEKKNIQIILTSNDTAENLRQMVEEKQVPYPVLVDESNDFANTYGVYSHPDDSIYDDHGTHNEPAYFLVSEDNRLLYQQKQTNPFGRPSMIELRKIIQYIQKSYKKAE
ncbi:peroxiredoxin family protein [Staphylococcus pseudintermedius]